MGGAVKANPHHRNHRPERIGYRSDRSLCSLLWSINDMMSESVMGWIVGGSATGGNGTGREV